MTRADLAELIEQYRTGIEAELQLLAQLGCVADRQRDVTAKQDFAAFAVARDERERLTRTLVTIEDGLRQVRAALSANKAEASQLPGFEEVLALHKHAADTVASILATDNASLQALASAELARRVAMAGLHQGQTTLSAYRKVLSPPVSTASLVERRG
jgi:hypothetical protein